MAGGFQQVTDGAVEIDGGTLEELQTELATEQLVTDDKGQQRVEAKAAPAAGDGEGDDAEAAAGKAGAKDGEQAGAGKKKKSIQARIDEIYAQAKHTERERDEARQEIARLRAQLEGKGGKTDDAGAGGRFGDGKDGKAADAGKGEKVGGVDLGASKFPKYNEWLQQGNDGELEDYLDARDSWRDAKATQVANAGAVKRQHEEAFTQVARTFNERMAPVLEEDPEFYEQIDPRLINTPALSALPPGTPGTFGNFLVEQVVRSERPKELLIHLSDPKVIRRLVTLQPHEILREITKYELSLGTADASHKAGPAAGAQVNEEEDGEELEEAPRGRSAGEARTESTSRAHPPAKPVRGSSQQHASPDEEPGDDASDDDWYRWANRRQRKAS